MERSLAYPSPLFYASFSSSSSSLGSSGERGREISRSVPVSSSTLGKLVSAVLTFVFAMGGTCLLDVFSNLLSGRLVREQVGPAVMSAVQTQMSAVEPSFEEAVDIFGTDGAKGLSGDSVEKLPKVEITAKNNVDASGDRISCSVCLQVGLTLFDCLNL
ncbi:hypothetical protein ACLOJK_009557 [Asimina triloba]